MTDKSGRILVIQDEWMKSEESSMASLSLEHLETGLPIERITPRDTSQLSTIDMDNVLEAMLIGDSPSMEPSLEITEQPKQRDLRFRYECEGRSAGSLLGEKSNNDRKSYPSVKINNYNGKAKLVVSLVTRNPHQLHPNGLVGKLCQDGFCAKIVEPNEKMTFSIPNLGIQCAKKKDIPTALEGRRRHGIDPFNQFQSSSGARQGAKAKEPSQDFEMNVVCLCFQAFLPDLNRSERYTMALPPQVSRPIFDKKGASLNISRVDRNNGTVEGGDEIFILCDKVQRDDIQVVFFQDDWEAKAIFGPSDIHRQVAIVCRTPPFKDKNIQRSVSVQFKLRRISDQETSDPVEFIYKPIDQDADGVEAKKRKISPHFTKFFKDTAPIKEEPFETIQQSSASMFMASQQFMASNNAAVVVETDHSVRQILRSKIQQQQQQQQQQQTTIVIPCSEPLDVRQPPREFARAVRRAPGDPRATYSQESSTFSYSHGSNMTFGTVTQRDVPVTVTTGVPFTFGQDVMTNSSAPMQFQNVPEASLRSPNQLASTPVTNHASACSDFGNNSTSQLNPVNASSAHDTIPFPVNIGEPLPPKLMNIINSNVILSEENIAALLSEDDANIVEELTTLQNFDPQALDVGNALDEVIADQGVMEASDDFMLENVNDSLSIPYCQSVELHNEPPS